MKKIIKTIQWGEHQLTLETGRVARQASSVLISMGDTVVLVTAVAKKTADSGRNFFPLTVNYVEKTYAAGKVPGGYFKREGRPSEHETLVSRLIDRPLRPLFPKGFRNEVQVIATVLSLDPEISADIPALVGASAAVTLSGAPFSGPIAGARVGYVDGAYVLNPTAKVREESQLDLVVAGTQDAVLMVESEAKQLPEEIMLGAVVYGHEQMQVVIQAIRELSEEAGSVAWNLEPTPVNEELISKIDAYVGDDVKLAYQIKDKMQRQDRLTELSEKINAHFCCELDEGAPSAAEVSGIFHEMESKTVRNQILNGEPRIDGRDTETVRDIFIDLNLLPRTHGSALFTRGETQAMVTTTLGTERDAQLIDALDGEYRDNFMLHYNFPPYCVGETGMMLGPKRRELGHGKLAKRALAAVLPTMDDFPYVLRVVSEITESNGSSSMATVCGASLAMMDAGVPIKAPVAGIAMGLIKEEDKFAVLTDILGDEDHLGDMDFKVAGTASGITALQMDIKIDGITKDIMDIALKQAKEARMHILGLMNDAITAPRETVSQHAPRIIMMKINPDKIRDVIGKGGATIRELTESTNSTIDISDDGVIKIAAVNTEDGEAARARIEIITAEPEVGAVSEGKVIKLMDFGAFVEFMPGHQGLVHISQVDEQRIENIFDHLKEGQMVKVKVIEIDRQGRVRLSMKQAAESAS